MSEHNVAVIVGMGQLGTVFAEAFARLGLRVVPVRRRDDIEVIARREPDPVLVLITTGEADLAPVLARLPSAWRGRVGLVQNELLPPDWQQHGIDDPSIAIVWFEKKAGRPLKVLRPTVVAGPARTLLSEALRRADIDVRATHTGAQLCFELVAKNLYILTTNLAGLKTGGTAGELMKDHRALALSVAEEILDIQRARLGTPLDREGLLADLEAAIAADREHVCRGRSAPVRLRRTLAQADALGIDVPTLRSLKAYEAS